MCPERLGFLIIYFDETDSFSLTHTLNRHADFGFQIFFKFVTEINA